MYILTYSNFPRIFTPPNRWNKYHVAQFEGPRFINPQLLEIKTQPFGGRAPSGCPPLLYSHKKRPWMEGVPTTRTWFLGDENDHDGFWPTKWGDPPSTYKKQSWLKGATVPMCVLWILRGRKTREVSLKGRRAWSKPLSSGSGWGWKWRWRLVNNKCVQMWSLFESFQRNDSKLQKNWRC